MKTDISKTSKFSHEEKLLMAYGSKIDDPLPARQQYRLAMQHWKDAETIADFIALVWIDENLFSSRQYAVLSKKEKNHDGRVLEMINRASGPRCCFTTNDGCVKVIGTDPESTLRFYVPNEKGVGPTDFVVFTKEDAAVFNKWMMNPCACVVQGAFCVENDADCDNTRILLSGKYLIYNYGHHIAFVEV